MRLSATSRGRMEDGPQRRAESGRARQWGARPGHSLGCRAAAGVVNQAVTSRRTATSQHQGRTAPRFDRQPERSGGSHGQAGDAEHLLAASTRAQTCKDGLPTEVTLNSFHSKKSTTDTMNNIRDVWEAHSYIRRGQPVDAG
ncbi:uncharacterized protein LJ206_007700 [Theristicus caerulescens]